MLLSTCEQWISACCEALHILVLMVAENYSNVVLGLLLGS